MKNTATKKPMYNTFQIKRRSIFSSCLKHQWCLDSLAAGNKMKRQEWYPLFFRDSCGYVKDDHPDPEQLFCFKFDQTLETDVKCQEDSPFAPQRTDDISGNHTYWGFLCQLCSIFSPAFEPDPSGRRRAASYLQRFSSPAWGRYRWCLCPGWYCGKLFWYCNDFFDFDCDIFSFLYT